MKIGIDIRKIADYGIGTHIKNVVLGAAQIARQHEFYFYYDPSNPIDLDPEFHLEAEPAEKYSLREHFSLAQKAKSNQIDLFHSPHYTLPLRLDCRSIVTIHDMIHLKFQEYFPAWKVQAAKYVLRRAAQKSEKIIVVSKTTRADLTEWMPELESKITVIYNRLSSGWFQPPPKLDLAKAGIPRDFILYVGNFKKHKGIETLIQAFASKSNLPPLVLAGQNHDAEHELTEKILSMPNVRLLGFASGDFLRALYCNAMFLVFPSLYEGFGYPPLEAMASGCPVLSSDAPAMKEVLGDFAEYFDRGNSEDLLSRIEKFCTDSQRRKSLSESGRDHARKYTSEEPLKKILELWT
jgi:glycosyltransferase involved in cell wall biosynthesis